MVQRSAVAFIALAAAFASAPAAAQSNFYAVASLGRSTIDVDAASVNNYSTSVGLVPAATTPTDDDTAYKFQLGYRFTPAWSVEAGYTNLGKADYIHVSNISTVKGTKEADLWNIDLVGTLQMNPTWALLGRIGAYRWETQSDMPTLGGGLAGVGDTGYDFKVGVGLQFDFNKNVGFRAEFERFNGVGNPNTTGDSKVNMFSVGAVLKF